MEEARGALSGWHHARGPRHRGPAAAAAAATHERPVQRAAGRRGRQGRHSSQSFLAAKEALAHRGAQHDRVQRWLARHLRHCLGGRWAHARVDALPQDTGEVLGKEPRPAKLQTIIKGSGKASDGGGGVVWRVGKGNRLLLAK